MKKECRILESNKSREREGDELIRMSCDKISINCHQVWQRIENICHVCFGVQILVFQYLISVVHRFDSVSGHFRREGELAFFVDRLIVRFLVSFLKILEETSVRIWVSQA